MTARLPQLLDAATLPLSGRHLVEASAGTGKTHTLADLYLRLVVESGHEVDRILVVTFTKAATAELKTRIRRRLIQARAALNGARPAQDAVDVVLGERVIDVAQAVRRLDAALMGFDRAAIFTLHGFCRSALRDHAFSAGLPMHLEMAEQSDDRATVIAADLWRRLEGTIGDPRRAFGLRRAGLSPAQLLADLKLRLNHPLAVVEAEPVEASAESAAWQALENAWQCFRKQWSSQGAEFRKLLDDNPALNRRRYTADRIERWCGGFSRLSASDELDLGVLRTLEAGVRDDWAALTPTRLAEGVKKDQKAPVHPLFETLGALLACWTRMETAWAGSARAYRRGALDEAATRLSQQRQRLGELNFSDLTVELRDALKGSGGAHLASILRTRFPAALIDEFQDTDPAQFDVFRAIYPDQGGEDGTFLILIGDPKQAIYGFRGADVYAYLGAREHLGTPWRLGRNWRSVPALVEAVNAVFSRRNDAFRLPGIVFYPVEPAQTDSAGLRAPGSAAALQCHLLPASEQPLSQGDAVRLAAQWTAAEIARLLTAAARGEAHLGDRPLQSGDIAVLVRAHDQGLAVADALRERGVGFVRRGQDSVFSTDEAQDLERILRAVLQPTRMAWLKGALATNLLGGTLDDVLALDRDEQRLEEFLERFQGHHSVWQRQGFMPMWQSLMEAHGVAARLLARPEGERRLTNVQHLAELLHHAAVSEHLGADALFNRLVSWRQEPGRLGDTALLRLESEADLVRIETIHASKGLQYPVVFCPALWKGRKAGPNTHGPAALCYHDPVRGEARLALNPQADPAIGDQAAAESLAEDLRLAYVALTRAQARCYVVDGAVREREHSALGWLLPEAEPATVWTQLSAERPAAFGWAAAMQPDGMAVPVSARTVPLRARAVQRSVPAPRVLTSFSALWGGDPAQVVDHDEFRTGLSSLHASQEPSPHGFPRGAMAGRALHAILERWQWHEDANGSALASLTAQVLAEEGLPAEWDTVVVSWLRALMATPLMADGMRLGALDPARQAREMAFAFPVTGMRQKRIDALIAGLDPHWAKRPNAGQAALSGALRGVIDLVFEYEGRYYLVDYKSNWLGPRAQDYTAEALAAAMAGGGYTAQALIYALALHRHVRACVPAYDPARDFGGVFYLFLRGMAPDAPGRGVVQLRPDPALLRQLDALMAGGEAA